jgi:uncharacterized lipoprotein YmbA
MKKLIWIVAILLMAGCAALPTVVSGLSLAATVLPIVDSFYDNMVQAKSVPDKIKAATIVLQQADLIAQQVQALTQATTADQAKLTAQAQTLAAQAGQI